MLIGRPVTHLSVIGLLVFVSLAGCADDGGGAGFNCQLTSGIWRAKYTLRAGSDSECNQVPERTLQIGGLAGSAGDSSTCDEGCSCTSNSNDTTCSSTYKKTCDFSSTDCSFTFQTATSGRGVCQLSADLDCTVDITITWEAP